MPAHVTLRLDFPAERRLGHGKVSLLEAVRRNGSIAAAGREFGMSYRRAWLLVDVAAAATVVAPSLPRWVKR
jgi:molybdate transport system regulatory protein